MFGSSIRSISGRKKLMTASTRMMTPIAVGMTPSARPTVSALHRVAAANPDPEEAK